MPGTITHLWIFKKTMFENNLNFLKDFSDEPKEESADSAHRRFVREFINNLKTSHKNLVKTMGKTNWDRKKLEKMVKEDKNNDDEAGVLASYGYLGSNGPDIMSLPKNLKPPFTPKHEDLASLSHYNKSGALVIHNMVRLKSEIKAKMKKDAQRTLECKLSYWLGHICHLAADIVAHPFVNSRAGALQMLEKKFRNFRGNLLKKLWKTHNVVEQLQDTYVKCDLFKKPEKNNWKQVDLPVTASIDLRQNKNERAFIGRAFAEFYGQKDKGAEDYEYDIVKAFFINDKTSSNISFRYYCNVVTPNRKEMNDLEDKVAGKGIGKDEFKNHIEAAADLSREMIKEALKYLVSKEPLPKGKVTDEDVWKAKTSGFKYLQMNWNIDTGHGFMFEEVPSIKKERKKDPYRKLVRLHVCTYPSGNYTEPKSPPPAPVPNPVKKGKKKKNTIKSSTPRWCVEVLPQALVRKEKKASLDLWTVSTKEKKVTGAGGSTRKEIAGEKSSKPTVNRVTWWEKKWSGSAVNTHTTTGSGSQAEFALLAFGKQKKDKDTREGKGWNDLLNKMIIITPQREDVWDVRGSSGYFNDKSVKKELVKYPTEQVYLKFHVFDDKGKAVLQCDKEGKIKKPEDVKPQPRIHNVIIELEKEKENFKIKKVSLDGDRMCLWKSNDVKKRLTSTSEKPVSEPKKEVIVIKKEEQTKAKKQKPQAQKVQTTSWCPNCKAVRRYPPGGFCQSCQFGKTVPLSQKGNYV